MTFQEAYDMANNPTLHKANYCHMMFIAEDDYVEAKEALEELQGKGYLTIEWVSDIFKAYVTHSIGVKLNPDALPSEIEFDKEVLKLLGDVMRFMDNMYFSKDRGEIIFTKKIYESTL